MIEPFSAAKVVTGLAKPKNIGLSITVAFWFLVAGVFFYGGYLIYQKVMQTTEVKNAEQMVNYTLAPKQTFFGCCNLRVDEWRKSQKEAKK